MPGIRACCIYHWCQALTEAVTPRETLASNWIPVKISTLYESPKSQGLKRKSCEDTAHSGLPQPLRFPWEMNVIPLHSEVEMDATACWQGPPF